MNVFIKLVCAKHAQVFKASTISNVRRNRTIFVPFVSHFRQKYVSIPICYVTFTNYSCKNGMSYVS